MYQETRDWITANWDEEITLREWWARMNDARLSFPRWPTEWFGRNASQSDRGGGAWNGRCDCDVLIGAQASRFITWEGEAPAEPLRRKLSYSYSMQWYSYCPSGGVRVRKTQGVGV
jgi:hypothetical protein